MQQFKIDNYIEDTGLWFLHYRKLPDRAATSLENRLKEIFKADSLDNYLVKIYEHEGITFNFTGPIKKEFFLEIPNHIGKQLGKYGYVIWDRGGIDIFKMEDLLNNINYIWYPVSDDIAIVDAECKWVTFIRHYNEFKLVTSKTV
jgi:hypothetical protein